MKKFTNSDLNTGSKLHSISCLKSDLIEKPMWYHERGLLQTATGYGRKLTTDKMIHFNGRLRRIYCAIHSNSGVCYILQGKNWIIINAH